METITVNEDDGTIDINCKDISTTDQVMVKVIIKEMKDSQTYFDDLRMINSATKRMKSEGGKQFIKDIRFYVVKIIKAKYAKEMKCADNDDPSLFNPYDDILITKVSEYITSSLAIPPEGEK